MEYTTASRAVDYATLFVGGSLVIAGLWPNILDFYRSRTNKRNKNQRCVEMEIEERKE